MGLGLLHQQNIALYCTMIKAHLLRTDLDCIQWGIDHTEKPRHCDETVNIDLLSPLEYIFIII